MVKKILKNVFYISCCILFDCLSFVETKINRCVLFDTNLV